MVKEEKTAEMLAALLEAAVDAIITINSKGIIESANQSVSELFGHSRDELLGRNISCLMPEPWASAHDGYLLNYLKTGEKKIIGIGREVKGLRSDDTTFPMHLSVSEFKVGNEVYYTGILHDMTVRKKTEEALHQSQRMEAIGQLTGGIAHDFNNLLTIIIGNLELMEMRLPEGPLQDLLNEAREAAELGAGLTERLLAFARRSVLTPEVIALNDLIKSMKSMLQRTLGEHIDVETSLYNNLWDTLIDPGQIESVILNLAVNARDAMPNGGKILVETRNAKFDTEYVENEIGLKPGEYVCLTVSDTGTGMTPEVRQNAFEPFFTTKESGRGTGLGLSMVYGFAKQSGGHVTIYSEVGLGTTINIYLPIVTEKSTKTKLSADVQQELVMGNKEVILVVEDDPKVQNVTLKRLESLNYQTILAGNGEEAVEILSAGASVHLVFTDLVMPGSISGYDLVEFVKLNHKETPILMTSGYAEDLLEGGKLSKLEVELLRKPYRQVDLSVMLNRVFQHSRAKGS